MHATDTATAYQALLDRKIDLAVVHLIHPPAEDLMNVEPHEAFRAHGLTVPLVVVGSTLPLRTALLMTGQFLSMVPRVVMQFPPKNRLLKVLPIDLAGTARGPWHSSL